MNMHMDTHVNAYINAAVFFQGIGYHVDKPLLYYAKRAARESGYETIDVPYGGFSSGIKGSPEKMMEAFESALGQAEKILKDVPWEQYDDILFISKSVGTAVAAAYAGKYGIKTRNIFFTPLEQSFLAMKDPGVVFTGTADPWVGDGKIPELCRVHGYPVMVIEGGNHSLETGDVRTDLDNMTKIMGRVCDYIRGGNDGK